MAHGNELLKQRFFFIKLPKNWFKNARVKKLRKIAGGDTFTIIYLKMLLLAANCNSTIIFEGIENTIEEELSLKLDEKVDDIKITVSYLRECGLLQDNSDGNLELIEGHGMIGSESYSNILKKNKRIGLENFQPSSNQIPTIKEKDIEKDKELEIDKELDSDHSLFGDKDISNSNGGGGDDDLPF